MKFKVILIISSLMIPNLSVAGTSSGGVDPVEPKLKVRSLNESNVVIDGFFTIEGEWVDHSFNSNATIKPYEVKAISNQNTWEEFDSNIEQHKLLNRLNHKVYKYDVVDQHWPDTPVTDWPRVISKNDLISTIDENQWDKPAENHLIEKTKELIELNNPTQAFIDEDGKVILIK